MPRLAGTASSTKSPITPRLATQHLRGTPSPSSIGGAVGSPRNGVRSPVTVKEDLATPAKSLISNNNITPRSSTRKSRIVEASSTLVQSQPTTPTVSQAFQSLADPVSPERNGNARQGAVSPATVQKRPRSVIMDRPASGNGTFSPLLRNAVTFSPPPSSYSSTSPREDRNPGGASFFHANDVPNGANNAAPQPVKKAATFFYANGDQGASSSRDVRPNLRPPPRAPSPSLSTLSVKSHKSQFYHADGTPDGNKLPPLPVINPSPELRPQNHRQLSKTDSNQSQPAYVPASFRPPSPLKNKNNLHLTYRKGASQIISPQSKAVLSPDSMTASTKSSHSVHERSISLSSLDTTTSSPPSSRKASLNFPLPPILSPTSAPQALKSPSPTSQPDLPSPDVASPTSTAAIVPSSLSELAANARRERKVLDLEISNSSLLAVNKQLERELRRQKAEVRRWRRLTRAGRIESLGSVATSMIDGLGTGSDFELDSDSEKEDDETKDDSAEDEDESEDGSMNMVRLEKDEKRLRLDLSRHRQLLVDSQRMNQSLKKCVAWSEEMIGEARRALAYKVILLLFLHLQTEKLTYVKGSSFGCEARRQGTRPKSR
jgi:hypothetical protein